MLRQSNSWGLILSSVADGTRPGATFGATITPGNNTYGSFVEVMGDTSDEAYMIDIIINDGATSSAARDMLMTIGFDFSGGTTYTDMQIEHLACAGASVIAGAANCGGVRYRFPIRIPAGTSIAAKASVNNATVGTVNVYVQLYCRPSRPELVRYGTFVRTYGADPANSRGTLITPGTTTEGAYTELGTLSDDIWAWEFGCGINDAAVGNNLGLFVDLAHGDATNKKIAILNAIWCASNVEQTSKAQALAYSDAKSGEKVYGRAQNSNGNETDHSMIAYGVGG